MWTPQINEKNVVFDGSIAVILWLNIDGLQIEPEYNVYLNRTIWLLS